MSASPRNRYAVRLFAAALRMLPRQLRDEHGDEMIQAFEDRWRDAAPARRAVRTAALARELHDVADAAIRTRLERRPRTRVRRSGHGDEP
jgi:hypothetical protein